MNFKISSTEAQTKLKFKKKQNNTNITELLKTPIQSVLVLK